MRLKYYLRGLGIGIIVTTIILMIVFATHQTTMTDAEIIERAGELGMIMPDAGEDSTDTQTDEDTLDGGIDTTDESETLDGADVGDGPSDAADTGETAGVGDGSSGSGTSSTESGSSDTASAGDNSSDTADAVVGASDTVGANGGSSDTYRLTIVSGEVCRDVCDRLQANGVVSDSEELRLYLQQTGYASVMSTGNYDIPYGLSMEEVAAVLEAGPVAE